MSKLQAWYAGLSEREQRVVLAGGVVLALLLLIGGLLMPLQSAVSKARERSASRHADLEWMRANQAEVVAGATQLPRDTGEPAVVLVARVGREAGLDNAFRGTQPSGGSGVRVQLEAAPFDVMIGWMATLEQHYGLSIESVTVERAPKPGIVNASVTFSQNKR
jgi:general secretion pathway protein M